MYTPNPTDPWDNALLAHVHQQGAQNPRILDKQPYMQGEFLYTVEADTMKTRRFIVWADGKGTARVRDAVPLP